MVASVLFWGHQNLHQYTHWNELYTQYFILLTLCIFLQLIYQSKHALNKVTIHDIFSILQRAKLYTSHVPSRRGLLRSHRLRQMCVCILNTEYKQLQACT
jgi:hypothetical protein